MTRATAIMLASLLLAETHRTWLPLPPPLPFDPPHDLSAPVPNESVRLPDPADLHGSTFALRIYRMREFGTGEGFIPGSAYASPEDRRPLQTPGFMVTVPLQ